MTPPHIEGIAEMGLPPYEDALLEPTEAQRSALIALSACGGDLEARASVTHWIQAWDKSLGRGDTLSLNDRIKRARQVWGSQIFENGGGI